MKELSAFIAHLHKDRQNNNNTNTNNSEVMGVNLDSIHCASFLVMFFRMGFNERTRRIQATRTEKKRLAEELRKKQKLEEIEQQKKNASKVNMQFTEEDEERAIIKLRTAAKLYDKTTPGAMSMKSFEVKEMPPYIFKEQLRRIFNLQVTPSEMGALMSVFDGMYVCVCYYIFY
jgi:hypothetical protein